MILQRPLETIPSIKELDLSLELIGETDGVVSTVSKLMTECWYPLPSSRLSALRFVNDMSGSGKK